MVAATETEAAVMEAASEAGLAMAETMVGCLEAMPEAAEAQG